MNVRIESLSVNGLGPIASIQWQFRDINLIYGRNEQGKTFLADYLLASLFRNIKSSRPLTESGQVNVSGLSSHSTRLDPKSRRKMEDYLFQDGAERPVDLARLLVVRGGELSFTNNVEKPLSKELLRDYLSDQRTLDAIIKGIPVTVQDSAWEKGQILGKKNTGRIKELNNALAARDHMDALLQEINQNYFPGEINKIKSQLDEASQVIKDQQAARRAYAYSLSQQIRGIENQLTTLPQHDLDELKDQLSRMESKLDSTRDMQTESSILQPQVEHFPWLVSAIAECDKRPAAFASNFATLFTILAALGTAGAVLFSFTDQPYGSLAAGLLALLFLALAVWQVRTRLDSQSDYEEVDRIFNEYEQKFGQPGRSIAALRGVYEALRQKQERLNFLVGQVEDNQSDIAYLQQNLAYRLEILTGQKPGMENPAGLVGKLQHRRNQLVDQLNHLKTELAGTSLQPEEYVFCEEADGDYNPDLLSTTMQLHEELKDNLAGLQNKMDALKQRVCDLTCDEITADWDMLIEHLRDKREEASREVRAIKAEVGSGILITRVINEFRQREDETISQALASPAIRGPIQAVSRIYNAVELEDNEIIACSHHQRFRLDSLSTGAREQILLALRIGIASHILKERKMFLILDDAFQHSDWERREWLVDEMATLAGIGWQVIYFTMDDHIRQLFEERIKPVFSDRYQVFELAQSL